MFHILIIGDNFKSATIGRAKSEMSALGFLAKTSSQILDKPQQQFDEPLRVVPEKYEQYELFKGFFKKRWRN